jgi:putative Holliday junction resolvase
LGRALAVDLGTRRVGLALSDPLRLISSPLETVPFGSMGSLAGRIEALCHERDVGLVVIGLPVRDDGREGEGCDRARLLAERLTGRGIRCELWDESWSSRDAEKVLQALGKTREKGRRKIDAIAASLILTDYLESRARA